MQVVAQNMRQVWDKTDEATESQQRLSLDDPSADAQKNIFFCIAYWRATKESLAMFPPPSRNEMRDVAAMLRAAERAMGSVIGFAREQQSLGADLKRLERLIACRQEARGMILMPTARQMSERDPEQRTPTQIRDLLLDRVEFSKGRPVISAELANELPCPFDPEPVGG
jgi:hypothetical protein